MKNLAVSVPQAHGCPFDDSTNLDRLSVRLYEATGFARARCYSRSSCGYSCGVRSRVAQRDVIRIREKRLLP